MVKNMRVDFYLLGYQTLKHRDYFACQLAQKAYLRAHYLYIHTQHQQQAQGINQLLWTFQDISFVPHQLTVDNEQEYDKILPILIGYKDKPVRMEDILMNLSPYIPPFFNQFKRLIEIVPEDEEWKKIMRKHYRYYRDQNCDLTIHKIKGTS